MSEVEKIKDLLRRAYDGDAWYGPTLRDSLQGVTSEKAMARPIPGAHSIWEIVLHVTAWLGAVRDRLDQKPTCSTCRKTMQILRDAGVDYEALDAERPIVEKGKKAVLARPPHRINDIL